jgi:hypothetical protein
MLAQIPNPEARHEARDEDDGTGQVAEPEGAVHEIGDFRPNGGRRDNGGPEQQRMELFRADLRAQDYDKRREGDR